MFAALIFSTLYVWAQDVASGCRVSVPPRGATAIVICRNAESGLTISAVDADSSDPAEDVDHVLRDAKLIGDPVWSSDGSSVALEVALDEEPGVLLVRLGSRLRVHFIDKSLLHLGLSGMGPAWSLDGQWLLFHTSGTGGSLRDEGIYAYRLSDRQTYQLLRARVSSIAVGRDHIFAVVAGGAASSLRSYSLNDLLTGARAVEDAPQRPVRFRKD
jgi:hypothetical protein